MSTELDPYDPARVARLVHTRADAPTAAQADALVYWGRSPYRMPQHLALFEDEVVEGELLEEIELGRDPAWEGPHFVSTVDDGARSRLRALEPGTGTSAGAGAEDPSLPDDVDGPTPEQPAGVRVAWKRPTDLIAEAGAKTTARGMDLWAALAERATGRRRSGDTDLEQGHEATAERAEPSLAPIDPFRNHDYRAQTPAPPETISR